MAFFCHPQGICESPNVGAGTRIWAFAHVLPGAIIGKDCNVCDGVFIENDVVVGDFVTIKSGVQLWDGVTLEDNVFVGPNATFTNDPFPRSKQFLQAVSRTKVGKGASIGANATILPGLTIGAGAMVGAGSVVTRSVPDRAIVVGNPARISGYVDVTKSPQVIFGEDELGGEKSIEPEDMNVVNLQQAFDSRGSLIAAEIPQEIPFSPKRIFLIHSVPSIESRGAHAHKECHQFLICISGSVRVIVDNGSTSREYLLDSPSQGIYMPPMTWGTQYNYSSDAVLLVLASDHYNPDDYIRNYEEFLKILESGSS